MIVNCIPKKAPSFGYLHVDDSAFSVLEKRMKKDELKNLKVLINENAENPYEIKLWAAKEDNKLNADVFSVSGSSKLEKPEIESSFSVFFNKSPLKFIKSMINKSNEIFEKEQEKKKFKSEINEIKILLDKVKEKHQDQNPYVYYEYL